MADDRDADDLDLERRPFTELPRPATVCIECGQEREIGELLEGAYGPVCEDCTTSVPTATEGAT